MPNTKKFQRFTAELANRQWLSEKTFEISLTRPKAFRFKPGQRISIEHHHTSRDYSLVSLPHDSHLILCIRHVRTGILTPILKDLPIGSRLAFSGPHGYFTYRSSHQPVVFVATGTGVAPFCAMARGGVKNYTLLHGVRDAADLYYADLFRRTAKQYVPCLSHDAIGLPDAFQGRVTAYLKQQLAPGRYDFYLCGHQRMISDATLIIDNRFTGSLVYTEAFLE